MRVDVAFGGKLREKFTENKLSWKEVNRKKTRGRCVDENEGRGLSFCK